MPSSLAVWFCWMKVVSQSFEIAKGAEVQFVKEVHVVPASLMRGADLSRPYQRNFPSSVSGPRHVKRAISAAFSEILRVPEGLSQVISVPTTDLGSKSHLVEFETTPSSTPSSASHALIVALVMASSSHAEG